MKLHCTFIVRAWSHEELELIHAWDEYVRDDVPDGYEADRAEALARIGDDVAQSVTVAIEVNEADILAAMKPRTITGTVTHTDKDKP